MNELMKIIENQLNNCKKLLSIFQGERQLYKDKREIGVKEVMEIMNKKKELVDAFEAQRDIMQQIRDTESSLPAEEREKRRELVRELASMFEQLLVIDRENEMLLRNIMNSKAQPAPIHRSNMNNMSSGTKERPALQRQLPLVPGMKPVVSAVQQEIPKQEPQQVRPVSVPKEKPESLISLISKAVGVTKTEAPAKEKEIKSESADSEPAAIYKYKPKSCMREYAGAGQLAKLASKYA